MMRIAIIFALLASPALADPALPDPLMTPGAVDQGVTLSDICNRTTKERRHVSSLMKASVLAAYSIPARDSALYEIDHLIPLALGGANAATNLWPQPWDEADRKDQLEVEMQRRACVAFRTLLPAEAAAALALEQREIAEDWVAAAQRYMGQRTPHPPPSALPLPDGTYKER